MDSNEHIDNQVKSEPAARAEKAMRDYPTLMNDWKAQQAFEAWLASGLAPTVTVDVGLLGAALAGAFRDVCFAGFCAGRDSIKIEGRNQGTSNMAHMMGADIAYPLHPKDTSK